ncbi:MAG TPA: ATP synthase F0 subunit B [Candidatus Binataceae bacterium]
MLRSMISIGCAPIARGSIVRSRIVSIVLIGAALFAPASGWCAEAGGAGAEGGSWLSLLFYIINFALFVWILMRYAGPPARKFFADRAGGIRETFARAETALKQAQDLANRTAERMSRLEAEKQQLRADLDAESGYIANRIRELAREAAARIVRDTRLTGDAITEAAQRQVRAQLAEATAQLARDLVARNFNQDDQARLLRGFEERLGREEQ